VCVCLLLLLLKMQISNGVNGRASLSTVSRETNLNRRLSAAKHCTKCTQQTCRRPSDVKWRLWTVATVFALRPRASTAASRIFPATTHLVAPFSRTKRKHKTATTGHCELSKKLRYRSRTARPNVSGKIFATSAQQSRNKLYKKKSGTNRSSGVRGLQSSNV